MEKKRCEGPSILSASADKCDGEVTRSLPFCGACTPIFLREKENFLNTLRN